MNAANGSDVTRLTFSDISGGGSTSDLTAYDVNPAWSPEGDRIVFHSGRAPEFRNTGAPGTAIIGQWEAYTVDAVNGENGDAALTRLTFHPGNDERCDWQALARPAAIPPTPTSTPATPPPHL